MRGNSPVNLEMEVVYGRNNSDPPAGPPVPEHGDKYVVFGLVIGLVSGGIIGGLLGAGLQIGSIFLTVAAGAFIGGFAGTFAGDRFKRHRRNGKGHTHPPLSAA